MLERVVCEIMNFINLPFARKNDYPTLQKSLHKFPALYFRNFYINNSIRKEEEGGGAVPPFLFRTIKSKSSSVEKRYRISKRVLFLCVSGHYVLAWKRGIAVLSAGNVKVSPDPRISLVNGYSLEIKDAGPQDAGDYVCQIGTLEPREITHTVEILGKELSSDSQFYLPPYLTRPNKIKS